MNNNCDIRNEGSQVNVMAEDYYDIRYESVFEDTWTAINLLCAEDAALLTYR